MSDPVVHFEIPADNPDALKAFYAAVFGWEFQSIPNPGMPGGEYIAVITHAEDAPGISGGMYKKTIPDDRARNYVAVASLDDTVAKVEAAGGSIIIRRMPVPGVGYIAIVLDPEGNDYGVIQADASAG